MADNETSSLADVVADATEAVEEAAEKVSDAANDAAEIVSENPASDAAQHVAERLTHEVSMLRTDINAIKEALLDGNKAKDVVAQTPALPTKPIASGTEEVAVEIPAPKIIPKKPHWLHRFPKWL